MNYQQNQNAMSMKDHRISWLSIFSSLCNLYQNKADGKHHEVLAKIAFDLNTQLQTKYPDNGNVETGYSVGDKKTPF